MTARPIALLRSDARPAPATIALSEGTDPRIVEGGLAAVEQGFARIILVGETGAVEAELEKHGAVGREGVTVHDPATSRLLDTFAATYHELRKHKGVDEAKARTAVQDRLVYAAMLVRHGHAVGTVGGAVETTSDVVRVAIQVIGKAPDAKLVSSFFLMYPPETAPEGARAMVYADCGLVIDPTAEEMAALAVDTAASCRAMLRTAPKVAMLSFSTMGSARHPMTEKVVKATAILREAHPDLDADGELQFDTAFVPAIATRKAPESPVAGQANTMVFPNLDAGNIAYKITQRVAGYTAIGPVLQGLAHPANDLSRGCSASDVTEIIAVTILQAQPAKA
ncbi:MAG: phosphate acetyltransferase [Roseovarius sp.]